MPKRWWEIFVDQNKNVRGIVFSELDHLKWCSILS